MALLESDIIDCIDKSISDAEKAFLKKHIDDVKPLKGGYTWECIRDNFGIIDEKIECVLESYIAKLDGYVIFGNDCFTSNFQRVSLDFKDF